MDFDKGRTPQEQNKNGVLPKPQQNKIKPNATTRVSNNVGLRVFCFLFINKDPNNTHKI